MKPQSDVSKAFAYANAINLPALLRFPVPVLRQALGLAKGIVKRTDTGGYQEVQYCLEQAILYAERGGITPLERESR